MLACFVAGFLVAMAVAFSECNGELWQRKEFSRAHRAFGRAFCFTMAALGLAAARYL